MCSVGLAIAQDQGEYKALTTNKQITLCLDKLDGILIGASENKTAQAHHMQSILKEKQRKFSWDGMFQKVLSQFTETFMVKR